MKKALEHVIKAVNRDVKFRLAEIVLICDLDLLIRHHLAIDGSGYNEVEHIQNYVGNAIFDAGS